MRSLQGDARIAGEQEQHDLVDELVPDLAAIAPNDEQVRTLLEARSTHADAKEEDDVIDLDDEVEVVEDDEERRGAAGASHVGAALGRAPGPGSEPPPRSQFTRSSLSEPSFGLSVIGRLLFPNGRAGAMASEPLWLSTRASTTRRQSEPKAIADAESFRKLRLHAKAAEALSIALELDPRSQRQDKLRRCCSRLGSRRRAYRDVDACRALPRRERSATSEPLDP